MTAFKPQQRHLTIRGRTFHFVSYEGRPENTRRAETSLPPMWFLMVEGRRCPVLPCEVGQPLAEVDAALSIWAEDNALGPVESTPRTEGADTIAARIRWGNWWGAA
jgi:hypothetical protein